MENMEKLLSILYIIIAVQSIFLSIVFFFKKSNAESNRLLSFLLLLMSLIFVTAFLEYSDSELKATMLSFLSMSVVFLMGPIIYLYSSSLFRGTNTISFRKLYLFIPFIILLPTGFAVRSFSIPDPDSALSLFQWIIIEAGLLQMMIYTGLIIHEMNQYSTRVNDYFSSIDGLKPVWIKVLTIVVFLASFIHFIANIIMITKPALYDALFIYLEGAGGIIPMVYIFSIAYFALTRPELFEQISDMKKVLDRENEIQDVPAHDSPKYEKQRLDESLEKKFLTRLLEFMEKEKPYMENSLTLKELSLQVDIPSHLITMIINLHLKQNYYRFINSYRITEACRRLISLEYLNESILTIALNTGFNSKSTFNGIFRKMTGMTPREYRREHSAIGNQD